MDGSSLFCADKCLSASPDFTATYGIAYGCSETGSGQGYCQKCDPQCVSDATVLPLGKACEDVDVCGSKCPACYLITSGHVLKIA